MGVSANSSTVLLITSSGSDEMSAERMNHCLPAAPPHTPFSHPPAHDIRSRARTLRAQHLRDALLLVYEALLIHLVQQALLAAPRRDRVEVLLAARARPDEADLHDHERVLVRGARREQHVGVQLARRALDAVAEVPDERPGGRAVEATGGEGEGVNAGEARSMRKHTI